MSSLTFLHISIKYIGQVCVLFMFFPCKIFGSEERRATEEPPQQTVVFPYWKRLCKVFYPILEIANSPISKSNLLCEFAYNFSLGDLMLANMGSVCICSFFFFFFPLCINTLDFMTQYVMQWIFFAWVYINAKDPLAPSEEDKCYNIIIIIQVLQCKINYIKRRLRHWCSLKMKEKRNHSCKMRSKQRQVYYIMLW